MSGSDFNLATSIFFVGYVSILKVIIPALFDSTSPRYILCAYIQSQSGWYTEQLQTACSSHPTFVRRHSQLLLLCRLWLAPPVITRARPSIYLATVMTVWGALTTCTAAADNLSHLVIIRFFLGCATLFHHAESTAKTMPLPASSKRHSSPEQCS